MVWETSDSLLAADYTVTVTATVTRTTVATTTDQTSFTMTVSPAASSSACSETSLLVSNINGTYSYAHELGTIDYLEFEVDRNPAGDCEHVLTVEVNGDTNYEAYGIYIFSEDDSTGDTTTVKLYSITYDESLTD